MKKKGLLSLLIAFSMCLVFTLIGCAGNTPSGGAEDGGTFYTVRFDSKGGSAVVSQTVREGDLISRPVSSRAGFDLLGWYKDADTTDEWHFDADRVTNDITLYAGWQTKEGPVTKPETSGGNESESDILVVWFSYSNRTEGVANEIVSQSGGKGVEIVPSIPYTAEDTNYNNGNSRSQVERRTDARPEIADTTYGAIDIAVYKTVIIGYPIWNSYEPMIIRTFIEHYNGLSGKDVYTFSTSASSPGGTAYNSVVGRCPNAQMKGNFHLTSSTLSDMKNRVHTWLDDSGLLKTEEKSMYVTINGHKLEVTLAENSSVGALVELLSQGDIIYTADDYGNFEKVGDIGHTLPQNNTQITTEAGDVILYQGRSICLYYAPNTYTFTRIGKINGYSASELRTLLGAGNGSVQVKLSLTK